jgi:alpha-tubulin suppressor-like RCC1 family protein
MTMAEWVSVSGLSSGVVALEAGSYHTCVLTSGGSVQCWGRKSHGQLGDNSTTDRLTPVGVVGFP